MVDGSQTIAWVDRRVGALTEARIEARQAIMRNTVDEARERLYQGAAQSPCSPYDFGQSVEQQLRALELNDARKWAMLGVYKPMRSA